MNIFKEATDNIHDYTETVSDYISWCTSLCVPVRTVHIFPNQKSWFNADVQKKIKERRVTKRSIKGPNTNCESPSKQQKEHAP